VEDLTESEQQGIRLLSGLMELNPNKRLSAKEALGHEFFTKPVEHDVEWGGELLDEEEGEATGEQQPQKDAKDEVDMVK
jgi:cell division control protein 7